MAQTTRKDTSPAAVIARAKRIEGFNSELSFPARAHSHGIQLIFKQYSFAKLVAQNAGRELNSVQFGTKGFAEKKGQQSFYLPFPTSLQDSTGLTYNNFERDLVMSVVGESLSSAVNSVANDPQGAAAGAKNAQSKLEKFGSNVSKTLRENPGMGGALMLAQQFRDGVGSGLKLGGDSAKLFAAYLARNFNGDIGKTIAMDSGMAINPSETLAFEGVDLKSYTFDWDLYPESKEDSDRIKDIIKSLKRRILPTTSGGGFGESASGLFPEGAARQAAESGPLQRMFLSYPDAVYINLVGVDGSHFPQFKPAMCTGMDVDYGATGNMVIAKGGRPAAVNISLSFSELVIHTAEDYGEEEVEIAGAEEKPKTFTGGPSF
jgi:hypothetical protein